MLGNIFVLICLFVYKNVITLFLTIALLLWSVENAFAQSDSGSPYIPPGIGAKPGSFISNPGESAEPPREPPVTYVRKSVRDLAPLYLMEKNGELIPALNWTSEELDSLLQRVNENQRQADLPDYICESLTLTGVQKGETAEMLLKMQFTVPQKPVIRIPLQLNGVILLEAPKCTTGEFLAPQSGGGYVLFLKSEDKTHNSENQKPKEEQTPAAAGQTTEQSPEQAAENNESSDKAPAEKSENHATSHIVSESDSSSDASQKHEISLKILVPLQKNQSTYTLNMRLPKALFSQITLETPFSSVETRASSHAVVQPSESLDDGKKTRINAYSLGSEFQLQWQASESQDSNSRILESFTDIHVDIRPGVIFYTANMRLQYANQPPSEFILNLPPSAELLPSSTNEYSIERLSGAQPNVQNAVKIRLNNEYKSSSKLTFQARLPIEQTASVNWQDVMGFGIRGSVRQNGCIGVNVDKSYQVIWNPGQYVSRVDELPKTYEGEYQYAFLFSEQPCSLMARIVAGRTRINVQPQYNVFIGEEEMRLDVSWTYNIRGGQVNWLDVDLNGWQLRSVKDIGPENTFTSESREDGGRMSARLAQPTTGTVNMKMTLYAAFEPDAQDISFSMPQPRVNSPDEDIVLSPGILYVVSATNVKLNPTMDKTEKLVKQNYSASDMQKTESGELFCYRVDDSAAQFKSSLTVLPQQIEVQSTAQTVIFGSRCLVKQSFDFSVLYKPVSQAAFTGSNALAEMEDLKFTLDGKELNIRKTTENGYTRVTAIIGEAKIGNFVIEASYSIPLSEDSENDLSDVQIPLVSYENPEAEEGKRIVACKSILLGVERAQEFVSVTSDDFEIKEEKQSDMSELQKLETSLNVSKKSQRQPSTMVNGSALPNPFKSFLVSNSDDKISPTTENGAELTISPLFAAYGWSLTPINSQSSPRNSSLQIKVKRRKGMVWDSLTIDRAWIQTMLTPTRRQDAVSFRFVSKSSHVTLVLPPDADMGSLQILLDSHSMDQFRPEQGQRLVISVPDDGQTHVLELSYYFVRPSHGFKKENIQLPYIEESKWTRWLYWSLCVPRNIHLLTPPKELNAEYSWQRQGPFFRRNSIYAFSALEEWSGGRNLPDPPQGTNIYLFSGFGQIQNVEVILVDRSILVISSSLIVLILGLIILHIKRLRKIWTLALLAIALLFASLWEPEIALTILQASALGCALLALSFIFRKKAPSAIRSESTIAQLSSSRSRVN